MVQFNLPPPVNNNIGDRLAEALAAAVYGHKQKVQEDAQKLLLKAKLAQYQHDERTAKNQEALSEYANQAKNFDTILANLQRSPAPRNDVSSGVAQFGPFAENLPAPRSLEDLANAGQLGGSPGETGLQPGMLNMPRADVSQASFIGRNPVPDVPLVGGGSVPYGGPTSREEVAGQAQAAAMQALQQKALETATLERAKVQGNPKLGYIPPENGQTAALDRQALDALARGDKAAYERILKVKKDLSLAEDKPKAFSAMDSLYGAIDPKAIADSIQRGEQSPILTDLGRPAAAAVSSELAKRGVDVSKMQSEWKSVQRFYLTKQGPQQLRIRQSMDVVLQAADEIERLAKEWDASGFRTLNKATLLAAKEGVLGPKANSLAILLDAQITDSVEGMATVFMGGNAPTEKALGLAEKQLKSNWSKQTLLDAVQLVRKNIGFRAHAVDNIGPSGVSPNSPYLLPTGLPPKKDPKEMTDEELLALYSDPNG